MGFFFGKTTSKADFARLMEPHLLYLGRVAMRLTRHRENAEDLIQDFLIKVYAKQRLIASMSEPRPWLTRVLYNLYIDQWRSQKSTPQLESIDKDGLELSNISEINAMDLLQMDRQQQMLQRLIDELPEDQRIVIILHDIEEYTLPEVAEVTSVALGTLKSRLHRARNKLKKRLLANKRKQQLELSS